MVRRRAQRAVSNHGGRVGLAAILRDALASLGLLRLRSEWRKLHRLERRNPKPEAMTFRCRPRGPSIPGAKILGDAEINTGGLVSTGSPLSRGRQRPGLCTN